MNLFCNLIADQKSEDTKEKTNYGSQTLYNFSGKGNELREIEDVHLL